nr:MAG TPA: PUTATIVE TRANSCRIPTION REGULATOR, HTH DNA-BINDING MOTIF [Caudoviricetes sp.]
MFPNLEAEMAREKISIKKLSELTDINYETLKLKLRGVTEFKLGEMLSIKRKVFTNETLDYLFTTEEEE